MIRTLQNKDRDKIEKLLNDTKNFKDFEIEVAMELIDAYLKDETQSDYHIFVDEENEEVKGYVCIGTRPMTKGTWDLYWIAVNPLVQARGVGSGLIAFSESYIKENGGWLIWIETSGKESYEKERKFYLKNGYEKISEVKDFYDRGDSLVVYGKYI